MKCARMDRALQAGTVRVRWLSLEDCPERHILQWKTMLDAAEIARAERFRYAADRDVFIAAHALLRTMLSMATDLHPASWRYVTGIRGKPAIAPGIGDGSLRFNISHTRGLVACALVHHLDVGLDVEASDRGHADYVTVCRSFSPDEARLVSEAPADLRRDLFFRLWTLKESFLKATGEGLGRPLNSFSFRFDPLRIVLHPRSGCVEGRDDGSRWQCAEFRPAPHRLLAVTTDCGQAPPVLFDAAALRADTIGLVSDGLASKAATTQYKDATSGVEFRHGGPSCARGPASGRG